MRRAEEHLQAAKALAADPYEATKGKTHEAYLGGPGPAQAALKEAEALAKAAREKVLLVTITHFVGIRRLHLLSTCPQGCMIDMQQRLSKFVLQC